MCHCDGLFQSPVVWDGGTDLIFLSKYLVYLFRDLFVVEAELDGDGVEGGIPGGITWVLAGFGSLSKEVHTFYWLIRSFTISPAATVLLPHSRKLSAAAFMRAEVTLAEMVEGLRRGV